MELDIFSINIAIWVIVGIISGIIIHLADPKDSRGGVLFTIFFGVQGAFGTAFFYTMFFGIKNSGFDLSGFLMAILGGLFVGFIQRLILRKEEKIDENVYYKPWFSPLFSESLGQKGGQQSLDQNSDIEPQIQAELNDLVRKLEQENLPDSNGVKKEKEEENIRWF